MGERYLYWANDPVIEGLFDARNLKAAARDLALDDIQNHRWVSPGEWKNLADDYLYNQEMCRRLSELINKTQLNQWIEPVETITRGIDSQTFDNI